MRRIAVTLDALEVSAQALEHAVHLAERMGAQVEGIFIEDIDLIEISELPFVKEVRRVSRSEIAINLARMEQELRALARRAERLLSEQASRHNVAWSFRTWRGSIDSDLLAADIEADVLSRLGAVLARGRNIQRRSTGVAVLYTGSDASMRALDTANKLASDPQRELIVLVPVEDDADAIRLQKMALGQLPDDADNVHFVRLSDGSLADLQDILTGTHSAVLVLERDSALLRSPSLKQSLNSLDCPLLVVR